MQQKNNSLYEPELGTTSATAFLVYRLNYPLALNLWCSGCIGAVTTEISANHKKSIKLNALQCKKLPPDTAYYLILHVWLQAVLWWQITPSSPWLTQSHQTASMAPKNRMLWEKRCQAMEIYEKTFLTLNNDKSVKYDKSLKQWWIPLQADITIHHR